MGRLKTLLLILLVLPVPVRAELSIVSTFAACAGRFSAEMEHAWLVYDRRADEYEHRRRQFIELLGAIVPSDELRKTLHLRIDAKMAHAELLSQASFSKDADRSRWALRRAKTEIDYCSGFLLDS